MTNARARILWTSFALIVVVSGTFLAIWFAKGYRPSRQNLASGNGLLVTNSQPTGARVLIDGRFTSATDTTLYLDPGTYDVEMIKDGYFPWRKSLKIEQELVTQANARLFPRAPSLSSLTFSGAINLLPSPDGQKLLMYTASASATNKNGYYVLDLTDNLLAGQRSPRQVSLASTNFPPDTTKTVWSPNSSQLLLISPKRAVLIDPGKSNDLDTLADVSAQLPTIFSQWEEEMYQRDRARLSKFPDYIQYIATSSAVNVYFSPDEDRLLYTANRVFTVPDRLQPPKASSNSQPQARTTVVGGIYVYDRDEDRQFQLGLDNDFLKSLNTPTPTPQPTIKKSRLVTTVVPAPSVEQPKHLLSDDLWRSQPLRLSASPSAFLRLQGKTVAETIRNFRNYHTPLFTHGYQWFPTSRHILKYDTAGITVEEYDGTNPVVIYAGPFNPAFVYPWPNGSRVLMVTNFGQGTNVPENLYAIELR
jgi:hypothetical protein